MVLEPKVIGFHSIEALYKEDEDFKQAVKNPSTLGPYTLQDGFLFKGNKLSIPKSPLRGLIVKEAHEGALIGQFGINKTLEILKKHFY